MESKDSYGYSFSDNEQDNFECKIFCAVCKTGFTSTIPYEQHLKGSKHEKALTKQYMKKRYDKKYQEAKAKLTDKDAKPTQENQTAYTEDDDDDAVVITCEVCKKACTGHIPYKLHLASSAHAKQIKRMKLIEQLQGKKEIPLMDENANGESLYITVPQIKPFAQCDVCNKKFTGPEGFQQHKQSELHKRTVQKQTLIKKIEESGVVLHRKSNLTDGEIPDEFESKHFATCHDCGKNFSGPIPYQQHMISDIHKKQLKKLELTQKIRSLLLETAEDSPMQCKECRKMFNGPQPLYEHLKSDAHSKEKKKEKLLNDLLTQYPEMITNPVSNVKVDNDQAKNTDDSDDDSDFLVCNVCHKCFSGPESARDHFVSKKHRKAKKEKQRLEQLVKQQVLQKGKSLGSSRNTLLNHLQLDSSDSKKGLLSIKGEVNGAKQSNISKIINEPDPNNDFEIL